MSQEQGPCCLQEFPRELQARDKLSTPRQALLGFLQSCCLITLWNITHYIGYLLGDWMMEGWIAYSDEQVDD